jgi:hypothetical protein
MTTTALHSSSGYRRRLVAVCAAVLAAATLGAGLGAAPASAKPKDPCATARAVFRANMDKARDWLLKADGYADAGNDTAANQASAYANYYMGRAESALATMEAVC